MAKKAVKKHTHTDNQTMTWMVLAVMILVNAGLGWSVSTLMDTSVESSRVPEIALVEHGQSAYFELLLADEPRNPVRAGDEIAVDVVLVSNGEPIEIAEAVVAWDWNDFEFVEAVGHLEANFLSVFLTGNNSKRSIRQFVSPGEPMLDLPADVPVPFATVRLRAKKDSPASDISLSNNSDELNVVYTDFPDRNAVDQQYAQSTRVYVSSIDEVTGDARNGELNLRARFPGINRPGVVISSRVLVRDSNSRDLLFEDSVDFVSNNEGIVMARVVLDYDLRSRVVDVLVKGPQHKQMLFAQKRIENSILDLTDRVMAAGDLPYDNGLQDGIVDINDYYTIQSLLGSTDEADLAVGDIDHNGVVNTLDRSYLVKTLKESR